MRPALHIGDFFHAHGPAWRRTQAGHLSLSQLKAMSAIETCRTAQLGGHVERCEDCDHMRIAYNSCHNRHCPKCQGAAAQRWLEARQAELLPLPYYHVVFTVPAEIADLAYANKAVVYDILFNAPSEPLLTIAADPSISASASGSQPSLIESKELSPLSRSSADELAIDKRLRAFELRLSI